MIRRRRSRGSLAAAVVVIVTVWEASAARGQVVSAGRPEDRASVYDISPIRDVAVISASALIAGLPYLFAASLITPHCPCRSDHVNALDRGVIGNASDTADWISAVTVGLSLVLPPVADYVLLPSRQTFLEDMTVFVEAIAVNSALVTVVKYSVQRPIPRVYSDPSLSTGPENYRSFYSGHTSLTFAALGAASVTVDRRYGLTWQPWVVTAAVGTSVAAERVLAGRHFYTDVFAGAIAGLVVGGGVAWVHLRVPRVHLSVSRSAPGDGALVAVDGVF